MAEENLAGIKIKDSYEGLLHLSDGGLSVTPGLGEVKPVYDGQGRQTCLNLASNMLSIEGVAAGFAIDSTGNADYGFIDQGTSGNGIGLRGSGFYDGTQSSDLFVANSGDVGIGTESPGSMLEIKGNGSTKWGGIAIDTNGNNDLGFIDQGVLGSGIGLRGQGEQLGLQECDLYVAQGGNVGIGTEAPGKKLHIVGEMRYEFGTPAVGQVLTCTNTNGNVGWSNPAGAIFGTTFNSVTPTVVSPYEYINNTSNIYWVATFRLSDTSNNSIAEVKSSGSSTWHEVASIAEEAGQRVWSTVILPPGAQLRFGGAGVVGNSVVVLQ